MNPSVRVSGSADERGGQVGGGIATYLDERVGSNAGAKKNLRKVFPEHWSFMLGEIALYSFIILLLSGTYLTLFFKPGMNEVVYKGSYVPLQGVRMSEAYESTMNLSFDVRGGLLMRQIHHWSALIFVAAIVIHLMRIFFTGAFRKPRELNWLIGNGLLTLGPGGRASALLVTRRPALRHRSTHRRRRAAVHPGGRHLRPVLLIRRGVPRRSGHPPHVSPSMCC